MSEIYECVLVCGPKNEAMQAFRELRSPLPVGFGELDRDLFAVYIKEGRLISHLEDEKIANDFSRKFGKALLVLYDNSCGLRFSALYSGGAPVQEFGEGDEIWVPLDERGEPMMDGEQYRWEDIKDDPDGEYDCIFNAIDAGLEALGIRDRLSSSALKEKVVYDFDD